MIIHFLEAILEFNSEIKSTQLRLKTWIFISNTYRRKHGQQDIKGLDLSLPSRPSD